MATLSDKDLWEVFITGLYEQWKPASAEDREELLVKWVTMGLEQWMLRNEYCRGNVYAVEWASQKTILSGFQTYFKYHKWNSLFRPSALGLKKHLKSRLDVTVMETCTTLPKLAVEEARRVADEILKSVMELYTKSVPFLFPGRKPFWAMKWLYEMRTFKKAPKGYKFSDLEKGTDWKKRRDQYLEARNKILNRIADKRIVDQDFVDVFFREAENRVSPKCRYEQPPPYTKEDYQTLITFEDSYVKPRLIEKVYDRFAIEKNAGTYDVTKVENIRKDEELTKLSLNEPGHPYRLYGNCGREIKVVNPEGNPYFINWREILDAIWERWVMETRQIFNEELSKKGE